MQRYFAALPPDELAAELTHRVDEYYNWLLASGRIARWRAAHDTYYGQRGSHSSHHITAAGEKGELSFLMSNEYRSLVQHTLTLATKSRPALETVAVNTDSSSKAQTFLAKGIVEYYRLDGRIDWNVKHALEIALIMDLGWVFNEWDTDLGPDAAPDLNAGTALKAGDIYSRARTPLDVVVDFSRPGGLDQDWALVRDPLNKYDLAAKFPEQASDLIALDRDHTKDSIFRFGDVHEWDQYKSPLVDRWTFLHRKTPSLPQGRVFQFVTEKTWLYDGPLPYRSLPGKRVCPNEQIMSSLGYSNLNDLLSLQDVMDALISSAVTNMTTLGVNNIWVPDPANFSFKQLAEGMNLMGGAEKPEILQMNRLTPEWFNLVSFVIARMESISGVNSVARGNTQGRELSGAAMALLQSMAIEFNSGVQAAYNKAIEDCGNDVIQLTQDFAKEKRVGMIVGQANRYMLREYNARDLNQIQRVYVRQSNPVKDTTAGRLTIAQDMIQAGFVKNAQQYAEILDTGNLDSLMEIERTDRMTIDMENDALVRGEIPPVVFSDFHPEHLIGHRKPIANPDDRKDPALVERVQAHVQEHLRVWGITDPNVLAAFKLPPMIAPMPIGPPPGEELPGNQSGPAPGGPQMTKPAPVKPKASGLPRNPLSGKEWNSETGGLAPAQGA